MTEPEYCVEIYSKCDNEMLYMEKFKTSGEMFAYLIDKGQWDTEYYTIWRW